jgi:hypothetical protein
MYAAIRAAAVEKEDRLRRPAHRDRDHGARPKADVEHRARVMTVQSVDAVLNAKQPHVIRKSVNVRITLKKIASGRSTRHYGGKLCPSKWF